MSEQFRHLFVTPFLTPFTKNHIKFDSRRWIIFLDGLDECRGEGEQRRIVDLIRNSVLHCALSSPFIWVIASRPEVHLKTQFARSKTDIGEYWELEVPVDSKESLRDVERYLHAQFSNMREKDPDSIPLLWPSESDFLKVAEVSSGLFVFASTLMAYLLQGDPVSRLKQVISLIKTARTRTATPPHNPFQILDLLYTQIMSDVPEEILSTTKLLLRFFLLPNSLGACPLAASSNILALEQHETYAALRNLHSVLDCPTPQNAGVQKVRFFHTSFADFLLDPSRSHIYFIDTKEEMSKIWQCCTKLLPGFELSNSRFLFPSITPNTFWLPNVFGTWSLEAASRHSLIIWMNILQKFHYLLIDDEFIVKILRGLAPDFFMAAQRDALRFFDWLDQYVGDLSLIRVTPNADPA